MGSKELTKDELRAEGRKQGQLVAKQVIQNLIDSQITLEREQVDVECGDLLCITQNAEGSPFMAGSDDDWLTMTAAADAEIDVILDAVFVGAEKVSDVELAQTRLDGYEQCKEDRITALKGAIISVQESEHMAPTKVLEQLEHYVIPLLKKELEALGG